MGEACDTATRRRQLGDWLCEAGATHWGVAEAAPVEPWAIEAYDRWIASSAHAGMEYLERYRQVRNDPRLLLEGARSIVSAAFPYYYAEGADSAIAMYALGSDYHEVIRERLGRVATAMSSAWGCDTRVCVDTVPLRERYWAQRAGVGFIGVNHQLIVPGCGSYFFLGEIVTTAELPTDEAATQSCGECGLCSKRCPGGALEPCSGLDARRCLSYLTIEHRGDFAAGVRLQGHLYGCDDCQRVCPHNSHPEPSQIAEFAPRQEVMGLTVEKVSEMGAVDFQRIFKHSAVKRAKLAGLQRNAQSIKEESVKKGV